MSALAGVTECGNWKWLVSRPVAGSTVLERSGLDHEFMIIRPERPPSIPCQLFKVTRPPLNMAQGGEKAPVRVDRAKTCPHLIRVFYADKEHHRAADFDGHVPSSEVQIHTWYALGWCQYSGCSCALPRRRPHSNAQPVISCARFAQARRYISRAV
jgi:hypothetical protein